MKQLPEGTQTLSSEDQIKLLHKKVKGRDAFFRRRGVSSNWVDVIRSLLSSSDNPTAFLNRFYQEFADMRELSNIMAQLMRDGHDVAVQEFTTALSRMDYVMTGEVVQRVVPCTILILDFKRTLTMIEWIRAGHDHEICDYSRGEQVGDLTERLFAEFPTLIKRVQERLSRRIGYVGEDLSDSFEDTVLSSFKELCGRMPSSVRTLEIASETFTGQIEMSGMWSHDSFGFLFPRIGKSEVLPLFSRKDQKEIAMWQIDVPEANLDVERNGQLSIGFCSEDDWKNLSSQNDSGLRSGSCSHGFGCCMLSTTRPKAFCNRYKGQLSFVLQSKSSF